MKKLLFLLPLLVLGCDERRPPPKIEISDHLKILERGILNGYSYSILEDKHTGKKIFAYSYHGMLWLSDKTNISTWPNKPEAD